MPSRGLVVVLAIVLSGCTPASEPAPANASPAMPALMSVPARPLRTDRHPRAARRHGPRRSRRDRGARIPARPGRATRTSTFERSMAATREGPLTSASILPTTSRARPANPSTRCSSRPAKTSSFRALLAGRGDVAANLLLTFARDEQVAFAPPIVDSASAS